jgi:protoporphyrinogen oxidase
VKAVEVLILGAGPTGLGAAHRLQEAGADWHLQEAAPGPGGLAASFVDEAGFTWDMGGHVQFSHYDHFDRLMEKALGKDGWLTHERESWVWFRDRWVPYPFQYNLHRLASDDRNFCLEGLRRSEEGDMTNFGRWMDSTFGEGISTLFMRPYNFKVWAFPAEDMDAYWIGERVALPDLEKVEASIRTGVDHKSWGPNATFRFPKQGGTGAVWQAVSDGLPAERQHFSDAVVSIDPVQQIVTTKSGKQIQYRSLISTLPLNHLIRMTEGVVPETMADQLRYSSTHVVGVGMEGQPPEHLKGKCWMYFPDDNSPYYRVTVFSHYSPDNVPAPGEQWSLMTETSESGAKPVDRERLVADTIIALKEDGLIPEGTRILSTPHRFLPQGYPTPFLGRDAVVDPVLRAFEAQGIYSRGRFGAWKYEVANQDHSVAMGRECAERILSGGGSEAEPTLHRPTWVNGRRNP